MADFRPTRPRFRAINSVNVTVPPSSADPVDFDTVEWDDVGGYDGTNAYNIDRDGLYELCGGLRFAAVATAGLAQGVWLVNSVLRPPRPALSTTSIVGVYWSELVLLEAGDIVQLAAGGHATLNRTLTAGMSFMQVTRVGPKRWT